MNAIQKWGIWLLVTVSAVTVSYLWLDRPIALFVHRSLQGFDAFALLTYIPNVVTPAILIAFVAVGLSGLSSRSMGRLPTVAVLAAVSLAVAEIIKVNLNLLWPDLAGNLDRQQSFFINNGVYGFHPFHGGQGYASFPSGHTTAICAVMSVLWICYPRFRSVYAACIAAVAVGLVGADFHFLSDVIAGGFLGITTGWLTVVLWEIGARPVRPPK